MVPSLTKVNQRCKFTVNLKASAIGNALTRNLRFANNSQFHSLCWAGLPSTKVHQKRATDFFQARGSLCYLQSTRSDLYKFVFIFPIMTTVKEWMRICVSSYYSLLDLQDSCALLLKPYRWEITSSFNLFLSLSLLIYLC